MITLNYPKNLLVVKNMQTHIASPRGLVRAVDGVSFTLDSGKTLGLVGESGCGKSTLALTLAGLLPAGAVVNKNGSIKLEGQNLLSLKPKALRDIIGNKISIILQDPMTSLNPVMKVGHQIMEGAFHHLKLDKQTAQRRALKLLMEVEVPEPERRLDQYPHQLSGGLRQRVAIAMALVCEPQLLIADEPTTALDMTVQAEILDLLARLQAEKQMAVLLITHDLGVVAGRTHATAVMYAGKIVETAPTPQLLKHMAMPYTRALFDAIPRLADPPGTELNTINGQPPDMVDFPKGCRFAPRCNRMTQRCLKEEPQLCRINGEDHWVACWHPMMKS